MNTIRNEQIAIGNSFKKTFTGTFGIEIETEVPSVGKYPSGFFLDHLDDLGGSSLEGLPKWKAVLDHSLRNFGVEFIVKKPLDYDEMMSEIDNFCVRTAGVKFIKDAPGTSVHVHINMLDQTYTTMFNFVTMFVLFENLLVEYSGPTRRSNLFCLPNRSAEKTYKTVIQLAEHINNGNFAAYGILDEFSSKYSALNLCPLRNLGSVEVRSFRGTTNVNELKDWVSILNKIFTYAQSDGMTPKDIIESYRDRGKDFFYEVFESYGNELLSTGVNFESYVDFNIWYAARIAHSIPNWNNINTALSERVKKSGGGSKKKYKTASQLGEIYVQTTNTLQNLPSPGWTYIPDMNEDV